MFYNIYFKKFINNLDYSTLNIFTNKNIFQIKYIVEITEDKK